MRKPMVFEGIVAILIVLLVFAMYLMITGSGTRTNDWEINVNQPVWDIYAGSDGTVYTFAGPTGNTISAMDSYGNVKWKVQVPDQWRVLNSFEQANMPVAGEPQVVTMYSTLVKPVYAAKNSTLYVYLRENRSTVSNYYPWEADRPYRSYDNDSDIEERILAISHDGSVLWNVSIGDYFIPLSGTSLYAENDRIYAFNSYNLTLLDDSGSVIRKIGNISDTPAVDEQGYVYTSVSNKTKLKYSAYDEPSGAIVAYYPNGTAYWSIQVDKPVSRPMSDRFLGQQHIIPDLPIYYDRMLYLPLKDGVMAIATNGSTLWTREFDNGYYYPFPLLPIDSAGNIYLEYHLEMNGGTYVRVINKTGYNLTTFNRINNDWQAICGDPYEGRLYEDMIVSPFFFNGDTLTTGLENLTTYNIRAHNLINGNDEWAYTLPIGDRSSFVLNNDTMSILDEYTHISDSSYGWGIVRSETYKYIYGNISAQVFPYYPIKISVGKDAVYVSFFTANYEGPIVLGQSKCVYSGGIYALRKNGTLLWYKPTSAFASSVSGNNSTIYYATRNGEIGAGGMDAIAGGVTLLALAYVFLRFFMVGAVARAKDRLHKNENRNTVLRYITDNPGSTIRETSRGLGMNLGTLRYHVFILGINHSVVSYMADDKHIRYFKNSGTFSKEEQLIISLMKRDRVGKILKLLIEKPGLTNIQLSRALNIQESSACRYMGELIDRGIAEKKLDDDGTSVYCIKNEHKPAIARLVERIH